MLINTPINSSDVQLPWWWDCQSRCCSGSRMAGRCVEGKVTWPFSTMCKQQRGRFLFSAGVDIYQTLATHPHTESDASAEENTRKVVGVWSWMVPKAECGLDWDWSCNHGMEKGDAVGLLAIWNSECGVDERDKGRGRTLMSDASHSHGFFLPSRESMTGLDGHAMWRNSQSYMLPFSEWNHLLWLSQTSSVVWRLQQWRTEPISEPVENDVIDLALVTIITDAWDMIVWSFHHCFW